MRNTLIVIPVRAGSVGIPNKATRALAGGPSPLNRTITTALGVGADILVTSNLSLTTRYPTVQCVRQPEDISRPDVPLDAPVAWATDYMERMVYPNTYSIVVTLQCTSPFTTHETILKAIAIASGECTALTVRDDRGLRWETARIDSPMLATRAPRRVTRQKMPTCWRETGAVFATPRKYVEPSSRFAPIVQLIEVSGKEAVDLDTMEDWWIAERYAELEAHGVAA